MSLSHVFVGERTHPEDEEGINLARYDFASQHVKGKNVIDIGCGSGYGTSVLAAGGAKSALGIDYDPKVIQYAKKTYKMKNLKYQNVNVAKLSNKGKYDAVTAFEVIEHIQADQEFVKLISSLLEKNGQAYISTPNKLISSPGMDIPPNPYHVREYTPQEFQDILAKCFGKVELYGLKIKNKKKVNEENSVQSSLRWRIASSLVKMRLVRRCVNYLPRGIKRKFTGEDKLHFERTDFGLVKTGISTAPYMLAICSLKKV